MTFAQQFYLLVWYHKILFFAVFACGNALDKASHQLIEKYYDKNKSERIRVTLLGDFRFPFQSATERRIDELTIGISTGMRQMNRCECETKDT